MISGTLAFAMSNESARCMPVAHEQVFWRLLKTAGTKPALLVMKPAFDAARTHGRGSVDRALQISGVLKVVNNTGNRRARITSYEIPYMRRSGAVYSGRSATSMRAGLRPAQDNFSGCGRGSDPICPATRRARWPSLTPDVKRADQCRDHGCAIFES